jgi:hypothetical protein
LRKNWIELGMQKQSKKNQSGRANVKNGNSNSLDGYGSDSAVTGHWTS